MANPAKSSAELEAEVDAQRNRLSARVSEIQERLSPGQIVDELLEYAKNSGGREFVSNLSRNVQSNPLPVALTGIGLAWLMASSAMPARPAPLSDGFNRDSEYDSDFGREPYPYARVSGSAMRRVGEITDDAGQRYTEFTDDAGARFKAMSDEVGNRAGHFTDEAGAMYRGFTDETGTRVQSFLDEAGSRLADAQGWASDTWGSAQDRMSGLRDRIGGMQGAAADTAGNLRRQAMDASNQLQQNTADLSRTISNALRDQPLIGAALAFAVGAALGAAVPPTRQEDEMLGETADQLKAQGLQKAHEAYQQGKEQVAAAYEATKDTAAAQYGRIRDDLSNESSAITTH